MNTHTITIKNLKHFAPMSQETYCFTCDVLLDGKKQWVAENTGHGGSTNIRLAKPTPVNSKDLEEMSKVEDVVDNLVHTAIMEKQKEKDMKSVARKLAKKLYFRVKGQKEGSYYSVKGDPKDSTLRERVQKKSDVEVFINDLSLNEAVKFFYVY